MISFTVCAPPSTNRLFANVPGKGRVRTGQYRQWATKAGWEIKAQVRGETIAGPFVMRLWLPPGIDLDNCKAVADLIGPGKHGLGITIDDKHMRELHVYRRVGVPHCHVEIEGCDG